MEKKKERINIYLPPYLADALRRAAFRRGRLKGNMSEIAEEAISEHPEVRAEMEKNKPAES